MTSKNKKGLSIVMRAWSFFSSVTLAIVLIAVLALSSIVGTVIEQNAIKARNIQVISTFVGESMAPAAYRLLDALGFMDMYHSWWFLLLLCLLSLNLLVCSFDRLPRIWKLITDPIIPLKENVIRNLSIKREASVTATPEDVSKVVEDVIKAKGFLPNINKEEGGSLQVYGHKGAYSRLGVYVVHASILIIFLGAIIGVIWGFKGGLNLTEGSSSDVAYQYGTGKPIPLGFTIKCSWYETEFYGGSDMPKLFKSELSIHENGKEVLKKWIRVNDPLTYKGITFYQSSFGFNPNPTNSWFVFKVTAPGVTEELVWARKNQTFQIPGTQHSATVLDFSPALATDRQTGQLFTYAESMNNPAVKIQYATEKGVKVGWIWKRYPETGKLDEGISLEFMHYWGSQYTGLQVRKDPGVWLVYLGCILMSLALYVAFFMSHRKIWILVQAAPDNGTSTNILIGASAHKNKHSFQRDVDKMLSSIVTRLGGKD